MSGDPWAPEDPPDLMAVGLPSPGGGLGVPRQPVASSAHEGPRGQPRV